MVRIIRVLIIEKKDYCHYFFSKIIRFEDFHYHIVSTIDEAFVSCEKESFDLIILNMDINLDGALASNIKRIHDFNGRIPLIIVADKRDAVKTIEGMKSGAANVIFKPFLNIAKIRQEIINTLRLISSENYDETPFRHYGNTSLDIQNRYGIVGNSAYTSQLYEIILRIAPIDVNILIIGESGTGKELIADAVHSLSPRSKENFVTVNCGALPEGLIESSFFGYEKGAFTGADKRRTGYFEEADGGTIFLDEIGSMSKRSQVALLRVLQDQTYTRVGGTKTIGVNTRIIASTNKNLRQAAENGNFRADLYYRLNVVSIKTAPLRERKEDIPILASHFVRQACTKYGIDMKHITPQAMAVLEGYDWPGNIRELENFLEGVIALTPPGKRIRSIDVEEIKKRSVKPLDMEVQVPEELLNSSYEKAKKCFERYYFLNLLRKNNGNVTHSARFAKIHPATLHRKVNCLQIKSIRYNNSASV